MKHVLSVMNWTWWCCHVVADGPSNDADRSRKRRTGSTGSLERGKDRCRRGLRDLIPPAAAAIVVPR